MSLFNNLLSTIFGTKPQVAQASPATSSAAGVSSTTAASPPSPASPAASPVDISAILNGYAAENPEKLDWRKSIVDLMKLVGMDSSLAARKQLAAELNYPGDTSDTAKMNVWLHREVMRKLAENGGQVPAELLA